MITTDSTPTVLVLLPDWLEGINEQIVYQTEVHRSRRGIEQRSQQRRIPMTQIEYTAQGFHDAAGQRRLQAIKAEATGPLLVPWWTVGVQLQATMPSDTSVTFSSDPIDSAWDDATSVYLWSGTQGGEVRAIAEYEGGRNLTLTDEGTHTRFVAGSWCYPFILCTRQAGDVMTAERHNYSIETVAFTSSFRPTLTT